MRAALALLLTLGCGSGAEPDAGLPDAPGASWTRPPCATEFGTSYIISLIDTLPPGEGLDITGDGVPDNALGYFGPLIDQVANVGIQNGTGLYLIDVTGWDGVDPDVGAVEVATYSGEDAEYPPDPSNNLGGDGMFYVHDLDLDTDCQPVSHATEASIQGGFMQFNSPHWHMFTEYVQTLDFINLNVEGQIDADTIDGTIAVVWPACGLSRTIISAGGTDSLLDQVVAGRDLAPDIDVDNDGIERFVLQGGIVASCIDGDGTIIQGRSCPCSPGIVDGYSVTMGLDAISARILGVSNLFP